MKIHACQKGPKLPNVVIPKFIEDLINGHTK